MSYIELISGLMMLPSITLPSQDKDLRVVTDVVYTSLFHLSFFLGLSRIAGYRGDLERPQELQKAVIETDQPAFTFDSSSQHVVMNQFLRRTLEETEAIKKTAMQGLLVLRVSKFHIEHTAVGFDHCQAVEFAPVAIIVQRAEMSPVYLALVSRF